MRTTKQQRSAQRQQRIADAAITVIAEHGLCNVTHRRVARQASVSLAATTYYYQAKLDIVADASGRLLDSYVDAFHRFADGQRGHPTLSFRNFASKLVMNAAGKHRIGTLAWCEIILDAARHPETRALAGEWFANLRNVWFEIATALRMVDPDPAARSAIDVVIGLLFMVVPLGLSKRQVAAVLCGGADPSEAWRPADGRPSVMPTRKGRKAEETKERILAAAIAILVSDGAAAVSYGAVAAKAGLSAAAPAYHFPSVAELLDAAQACLLDKSKSRYRVVMSNVDYGALDVERAIDLTSTVFLREATEFGPMSLASFPIWLEAARQPQLRPMIWSSIEDQYGAWGRLLDRLTPRRRALDPLLAQCLFAGKLIRILATGTNTLDLANVRSEFSLDLRAIVDSRFWL